MNILLLILDGLADRPQAALQGWTPLEAAATPRLDRLATVGATGLLIPLAPGVPLESDFAHWLLFGYPPAAFPGRAAFEAIGRGVEVPAGSVVLLASFAQVTRLPEGRVRRDALLWESGDSEDEADCAALAAGLPAREIDGLAFAVQDCGRCEAILTLRGSASRYISDVDPFANGALVAAALPLAEAPDPVAAERTAAALNAYLSAVHRDLTDHPVNRGRTARGRVPIDFLVTKWAAERPDTAPFFVQNGLRGASVENYPLYTGIARVCGLTPVAVPHIADPATDLAAKLAAAERLFGEGYEFVHVHTKAPDVAAHRKDPLAKQQAIEALDTVLDPLVDWVENRSDRLIVVTGDHATPSSGPLIHSGEAVPLLIAGGPNVLVDSVAAFHERAVIAGGLGRLTGGALMPVMLNLTDRARLYGTRHQRVERPYRPEQPEAPFRLG